MRVLCLHTPVENQCETEYLDKVGDIRFHTDFRQVYADILQNWLKVDSKQVLGGSFEATRVISV